MLTLVTHAWNEKVKPFFGKPKLGMGLGLAQPKAPSIWAGPAQIGLGPEKFESNPSLRNGFGPGPNPSLAQTLV